MRCRVFIVFVLAVVLSSTSVHASGSIVEVSYPPSLKAGELAFGVTYRVWIPDGVKVLRGVIVHQHGCGKGACQGGETAADDLHWQALAKKWDCALLGPSFQQEDGQNCRLWCDPRNGSRARFLQALDDLAAKAHHPEIAKAPWCLWGHSGGGFWASLMLASDPERIAAVWLRSGTAITAWEKGEIPKPDFAAASYEIPVVCNPGVKERDDQRFNTAWNGGMSMFRQFRAKGSPIAFAPDPKTGHECGESRDLAIPFFDACLALRLPAKSSSDPTKLRMIDTSRGWFSKVESTRAESAETFKGETVTANWLPSEAVAKAWEQYVKNGTVGDATPPVAPFEIKASKGSDSSIVLTWDASADLESGLQSFIIERDGREIGRVPEKNVPRFGRPLFQGMSYHDTPIKPLAAMRFEDKSPSKTSASYRVIAVNGAGVASVPSDSVKVQ
jgi:hypothetical protein